MDCLPPRPDVSSNRVILYNIMNKVLFLCTGNSCRSQMAEAIVNARLGDRWQAFSAGTRPAGYVHPMAVQVLQEIGIEHHGRSKSIEEIRDIPFNLVVTVCDSAAEECPVWLGVGKRVHMGFPDPAHAKGPWEAVVREFRDVRDAIAEGIILFLENEDTATAADRGG
jgi:arsenate reductase